MREEAELAAAYFTGNGVAKDLSQAARWYEKAAEGGDPLAQVQIGYFYQAGIGVPVDLVQAVHWYELSAAAGNPRGMENLGVAYIKGIGVQKNPEMARHLFTEAFHKGCGSCASYLGHMFYFGLGVPMNKATAEDWYKSGTRMHDPMATYNLGLLYSESQEHVHDFGKAAKLFRTSVQGGYVPAMHALGLLLLKHPDLAKSSREALPLIETASYAGNWRSSMVLGILARDGNGVTADPKVAYYHFQIAVRQGGEEAQKLLAHDLNALEAKLSADKQSSVKSSADAWYEQHHLTLVLIGKDVKGTPAFPATAIAAASPGSYIGELVSATDFRKNAATYLDLNLSPEGDEKP